MIKIAIVIPIYNRADFLPLTLNSIAQQTYRPLELVLVDNNSTDESMAICHDFKNLNQSDSFEIKITSESKKGANAARNKGLELVTAPYVSFYDSDDKMYSFRMQKIAETIEKNFPDIVGTTVNFKFPNGKRKPRSKNFSDKPEDQILTGFLSTQTMTVKTQLVKDVGGWNESVFRWQDWELGLRLLLNTKNIAWLKNPPLDDIYVHEDSITGAGFSRSYKEISKAIGHALQAIIDSSTTDKEKITLCVQFKKLIVAGEIYREGETEISERWFSEILLSIPQNKKILFRILYIYKKMGGRGGWRIFKLFA